MKPVKAVITRGLPHGCIIEAADNSGARKLKIVSVVGHKTVRGRYEEARIGDLTMCSVVEGKTDMRKQVVSVGIVRQRRPYRRLNGQRVKFEDNAGVVLKDELGNPKGTMLKGPIAKEAAERFPAVAKIAKMIV